MEHPSEREKKPWRVIEGKRSVIICKKLGEYLRERRERKNDLLLLSPSRVEATKSKVARRNDEEWRLNETNKN